MNSKTTSASPKPTIDRLAYGLRGHINFVRNRLMAEQSAKL